MRRRLDIAASIVVTPDLLFLDEPTTGLDPRSRNQVWDIVRALVAEGTTVLLTTQYLDEADQLADRIAIIDHGKVIAEGTQQRAQGVGRRRRAARARCATRTQRADAAAVLARVARRDGRSSSPIPPRSRPRGVGHRARRRPRWPALAAAGIARRRVRARPAQPRRGVPRPHRPSRRRQPTTRRRTQHDHGVERRHRDHAEDGPPRRRWPIRRRGPPRPVSRWSASLTFGWRAMLKIKHVPMQLFDVTAFPIMFVLLFTYLFGGALAGSPQRVPAVAAARDPRA